MSSPSCVCLFVKFTNSTHARARAQVRLCCGGPCKSRLHAALYCSCVRFCLFSYLQIKRLIAFPSVRSDTGKISIVCQVRIIFLRSEPSLSSYRIRISARMECSSTGRRSCAPRSFSCTMTSSGFLNHKVGLHFLPFLISPN